MAGGFWESILGGGAQLAGYGSLMGRLDDDRSAASTAITGMQDQVGDMTSFQPWSVTSGIGSTGYDNGQLDMNLSQQQQAYSDQMGQGASQMFGQATMDPTQRESDIYERIRAMQAPEEDRAYNSMNAGLFGSGRGGMTSDAYGGSPEQHAFGMAQAEARNAASLGAMGQAQQEMQNYANIGNQMFQNQYMPWQQQMQQAGLGQNAAQLAQRGQLEGANMWTQLGLGGLTTDVQYSNIQGNAFGNMIDALSGIGGGVGGAIDNTPGGLFDFIESIFSRGED